MAAYSSSYSEVGENFVLARYLNSIEIPTAENSSIMSENSVPDPETPKSKKSTLKLSTTPITPERQTVSFANVLHTQSPGSAKSGRSTSSVTYKSRMYFSELEARGILESDEPPTEYETIINILEDRNKGRQALSPDTSDMFDQCLLVPGNEATIQTAIVPSLINLCGIILDSKTHTAVEAQFVSQCVIPLKFQPRNKSPNKIPSPHPDLTVGLRREIFRIYQAAFYELDAIAAPVNCAPSILFPCFSLEVKGDSGGADASTKNRNNAANMLYNLRQLATQAGGNEHAQQSFDGVVRVLSATVTQQSITISAHWTVFSEETKDLSFYSYQLKYIDIKHLTNSQWNDVSTWLQNAIEFVVQRTQDQVESDLKCLNDDILLQSPIQRSEKETDNPFPSYTASTSRKRHCPDV
ncbi:hypothetical protein N7449_000710 [Penicillium cf. viridicatum]|uniref:DUF7924 domain-containing protein n=1 Tax=Penicillium cf. viridicatum TaxID=2972119 RepID=A0A9W9N5J6_9EURO|nr:hypothetical protein N7449_000710 [Penicillium cf. viridicatum]